MGVVSPVGNDLETTWNNLINGVCGIAPIAAQREGIDWDALPDEWLSAIAEGDVTGLLPRPARRNKKAP